MLNMLPIAVSATRVQLMPMMMWATLQLHLPPNPAGNGLGESSRKHAAALRRCLVLYLPLLASASEVATLDARRRAAGVARRPLRRCDAGCGRVRWL